MSEERRLRVAAVIENVPMAVDFVADAARSAGLDDRAVHHCQLVVDEACTNVVEHGYGEDGGDHFIDLICVQDSSQFTMIIEDDSAAFDPTSAPDPDLTSPLADREPGGWGVYFIKKLMDRVNYERVDEHNRLTITKQIPQPPVKPSASTTTSTGTHIPVPPDAIRMKVVDEKTAVIMPEGRLDAIQSKSLALLLGREIAAGHKSLIIDLSDVEYLSSAGMKVLVSAWQRTRDVKGDLILSAVRPRVREVLQIIGLDLVFTLTDTVDGAVARLKQKK